MTRSVSAAGALLVAMTVVVGACAGTGIPQTVGPAPSLPGTPGHFTNGEFSFDYPVDWPLIATGFSSGMVEYVVAVMGNGTWKEGCIYSSGSVACGPDTFDVAPGGALVKVYRWWGGPVVLCTGNTKANATFGDLAVRQRVEGAATTWEIRVPGNEFGQNNNIFIEVHTSDPAQLARAQAIIAGFRWLDSSGAIGCAQGESPVLGPAPS